MNYPIYEDSMSFIIINDSTCNSIKCSFLTGKQNQQNLNLEITIFEDDQEIFKEEIEIDYFYDIKSYGLYFIHFLNSEKCIKVKDINLHNLIKNFSELRRNSSVGNINYLNMQNFIFKFCLYTKLIKKYCHNWYKQYLMENKDQYKYVCSFFDLSSNNILLELINSDIKETEKKLKLLKLQRKKVFKNQLTLEAQGFDKV